MNKICILLSTYNGSKYLKEQMDSLKRQNYKNIEIIARDDVSTDNSVDILESYGVTLIKGQKNVGARESFSILLRYALKHSKSDYFMFCDQDDIWEESKVEKSLKVIEDMSQRYGDISLLVHSDLSVVDEKLDIIKSSFWKYQSIDASKNSFENLLMQNTITGCTLIINRTLAKLSLDIPQDAIMHDWWIGLCCSCFGEIGYIEDTTVKYRQHNTNEIGAKGFGIKYIMTKLFNNENPIKANIKQAKAFLKIFETKLDDERKTLLKDFTRLDKMDFLEKRIFVIRNRLFKQGFIRNIGLMVKI